MLCMDYVYTCLSKVRHGWGHQRAGSGIAPVSHIVCCFFCPVGWPTASGTLLLFPPILPHDHWDYRYVLPHRDLHGVLSLFYCCENIPWLSFKNNCLEVCSQFQRFSTSLLCQGTWQHETGARAVTESYNLTHRQGEILGLAWSFETSKPCWLPSTRPNLLIFLILSNSAILW